MKKRVVAIGLDSADPLLVETWIEQGYLKNLSQLKKAGAYSRLNNFVRYCDTDTPTSSTERLWVMFLTGCFPTKTNYWETQKYDEKTYGITHDPINGAYNYQDYLPFYALGNNYRVAVFDAPVSALSDHVNGYQVLGWGGHAPFTPSHSLPNHLLPDLIHKYGKNPVLHKDYGNWWDQAYLNRIQSAIKVSVARRGEICRDLLKQEEWDLFLTVFGDTHSAGHDFWHLSQPDHPLYDNSQHQVTKNDPMREAFIAADQAIGEILSAASDDIYVIVFSLHGMGVNVTDMFSMTFLPELLYRFSFPGQVALAPGKLGVTPPPLITNPKRKSWTGEVWQLKHEANPLKRLLRHWIPSKFDHWLDTSGEYEISSPHQLKEQSTPLYWMPAMWYQSLWPKMKAFALPAFADGHIRINLKGRDAQGIVDAVEYDALCAEITQKLYDLKNGRTGNKLVKAVIRTRYNAHDARPNLPDADLVVQWQEEPADVVDSPDFGRIGPVTYYRSGGHRSQGFVFAKGPGITPGSGFDQGSVLDLAPTILSLIDAPIPDYFDGQSLVKF